MGPISSGLYLISSLTAADGGPDYSSAAVPVRIAPVAERPSATTAVAPMIFDLPITARTSGKTLNDMIADEVRRDPVAPRPGEPLIAAGLVESDDADAGVSLEQAVIRAHDGRIALLRQRMAAVTADNAGARQREALRLRLHRAEAARRLAIARASLGDGWAACIRDDEPGPCRAAMASSGAGPERAPGARPAASAPERTRVAGIAASRRPSPKRTIPRVLARAHGGDHSRDTRIASARPPTAAGHASPAPYKADATREEAARTLAADHRLAAHTLSHARHLLATARGLLEAEAGGRRSSPIRLAGFVHWEGSDSWSLAAGAKDA